MNVSKRQTSGKTLASYTGIFLVLFFVLLSGCVKVSVSCKVDNIDEIAGGLKDCKEQPNMAISKEF